MLDCVTPEGLATIARAFSGRHVAGEKTMAKGQMRSNKETRKPKTDKVKTASGSGSDPVKGLSSPLKLPTKK